MDIKDYVITNHFLELLDVRDAEIGRARRMVERGGGDVASLMRVHTRHSLAQYVGLVRSTPLFEVAIAMACEEGWMIQLPGRAMNAGKIMPLFMFVPYKEDNISYDYDEIEY